MLRIQSITLGERRVPNFEEEKTMLKKSIPCGLFAVAALAFLLAPTTANAQSWADRWGVSRDSGYSGSSGGYRGGYSSPSSYTPATTSQSYYNSPQQDNRTVIIQMSVPADARIWFGETATKMGGTSRLFASPPLRPGQYVYQVHVQWNENGKVVDQTRRVTVQAGDRITLDFTGAEASR
jgi:uncharacterized protein (TIGR03000 family)